MTDADLVQYIHHILSYRNGTSYKFYLLLSVLELAQTRSCASFDDLGRLMLIKSWDDLSNPNNHYSSLDKLKEMKNEMLDAFRVPEFCSEKGLEIALPMPGDNGLSLFYSVLTRYCVHLLLSYGQWEKSLRGIRNYNTRNSIIENLSQCESCLYEIHGREILFNSEYFDLINDDHQNYVELVKKELSNYLATPKK